MPVRELEPGLKPFQVGEVRQLSLKPRVLIMLIVAMAATVMEAALEQHALRHWVLVATTLFVFAQGAEIFISRNRPWARHTRRLAFMGTAAVQGATLGVLAFELLPLVAHNLAAGPALFGWLLILGALGSSMVASRWSMMIYAALALFGMSLGLLQAAGNGLVNAFAISVFGTLLVATAWAETQKSHRLEVTKGNRRLQILQSLADILLQETLEGPQNWAWRIDKWGRMAEVTPGFERATGLSAHDWAGLDFGAFLSQLGVRSEGQVKSILKQMDLGEPFRNVELEIDTGEETLFWKISGAPIKGSGSTIVGYVGANFDITSSKKNEQEIMELAHFDTLTGLLNRSQFNAQLEHLVTRLERYGAPFSLMLLDLDHFKNVNDNLGHLAGDAILSAVADRIRASIREGDFAARLGGDEFAILLPGTTSREEIAKIADRLQTRLAEAFSHDADTIHLGSSIGVVIAPLNGTRPTQLLRNADLALYRAKGVGRGNWKMFEARMDSEMREKRLLESELQDAISNGEIELYFQPLVDATTRQPVAFEALVRWNHPLRGLVAPAEFIPIAEESGAILRIGNWTIEEACRVAKTWPETIRIAVNLSPRHFAEADIVEVTRKALAKYQLDSRRLELEITEGVLMAEDGDVIAKLERLKALGVTIAMDDFGTGYSSLSYLLKFPFDKIKIDKSFVDRLPNDGAAQRILRAIASLGKALRMNITAEGIETPEQARFLDEIACHQLQGYFFSRPMTEQKATEYLEKSQLPLPAQPLPAQPDRAISA